MKVYIIIAYKNAEKEGEILSVHKYEQVADWECERIRNEANTPVDVHYHEWEVT